MTVFSQLVRDIGDTKDVEQFWLEHRLESSDSDGKALPAIASPMLIRSNSFEFNPMESGKKRAASNSGRAMAEKLSLPQTHPIRSLLDYLKVLGPLMFPLHRAALLRKRILFVGTPPLRRLCDFGAFPLG